MRVLTGFWERARGLLGTRVDAEPVAIVGCGSIHTVGMRYPLDVAFVSKEGKVLKSCRGVRPGRLVSCRGARVALERPASGGPWPQGGESLSVVVRANRESSEGEQEWILM